LKKRWACGTGWVMRLNRGRKNEPKAKEIPRQDDVKGGSDHRSKKISSCRGLNPNLHEGKNQRTRP